MKRTKIYGFVGRLIFLVLFNALFFIIGGADHPASVWISFAAINITYLLFVFSPMFSTLKDTAMETVPLLYMISGINFAINFVVGMIIILVGSEKYKFAIIIYLILFCIYAGFMLAALTVNSHTEAAVKRQKTEVYYIRNEASKVKMLVGKIADGELDRLLEKIYDNIHASPTKTVQAAASAEARISTAVMELEMAVMDEKTDEAKKLSKELLYLINERNRVISMNY